MPREQLPDEVKTYIVQAIACFDTPGTVSKAVKAEYGLDVSPQLVETYDPTKRAGRNLAQKWRDIREATRKAFLEDTAGIAVSHRAVRLRALQRMSEQAEKQRNFGLAASLLEQAAKECGNAFTNRRELTGKDGADLPAPAPAVAIFALPDNGRG